MYNFTCQWSIAEARQQFSVLIEAAAREPQLVFKRKQLAAVVIDPKLFERFAAWLAADLERTVAEAFADLRVIVDATGWSLGPGAKD
jgi:PHD/YefM family antitoxin component YafN of YafNO toxin-antitoxin module